ncbi:unnamed protein product [Schistosoma curassoni]|uniref:N6_N4_Mtase domain-containing protein n=1 Tax=Schistosoma curassoni TaxID=6186 RepID=A0A183K1Y1_9TREM|nr:unnamed protein product [Schistosoma curassoni]
MDPPYPPTWLNRWTFAFCPLNFINNINTVSRTSLEVYPVNKIYKDLLDLAAYLLYPNGRLVFWIPVLRSEFIGVKSLPHHPSFRLLAACEQTLNTRNSRYMVVMVKLDTNQQLNDLSNENEDLIFPAVYAK